MAPARIKLTDSARAALCGETALTPTGRLPSGPNMQTIVPQTPEGAELKKAARTFVYKTREADAFVPSPQQQGFFEWVRKGKGNALLEAVAGAGKTTTLVKALRLMSGSVFFGAYNRKIADEIKVKAAKERADRPGIFIGTMHGSGFSDWKRAHKNVVVDDRKVARLIETVSKRDPRILDYEGFVAKMVSFGKQFLMGVKTPLGNLTVWKKLAEHFSVDQELGDATDMQLAMEFVLEVFKLSADQCKLVIDFDDMIFAPIYYSLHLYQNDWVLIDECQDINPARRELARRMLKPGGRLIAVGDSRQAIYGFTGAGGDSVERIIEEFNCQRLPLTVTYRCPRTVVEYVRQWVQHIEAHPDAPEGQVRTLAEPPAAKAEDGSPQAALPWFKYDVPTAEDAILCRYTRPLIQTAFSMIRHGVACKVEGRDIGNGLCKLASRWKVKSLDALETRLNQYLEREVAKAREAKSESKEQQVTDVVETLKVFIERCRSLGKHTVGALTDEIQALFADDVQGMVTLSTGHKAKGREWPRVYWIQTAIRQRNLKDWEMVQEVNIKYVIGTRAQRELVLLPELA